ncbi:REP-associated tyrosine transposase [Pseudothauera rhizosphaerae]|uniref:Transposase n=1 Tax=Pseudothauera rhizosphaerae TaxID=2565932 RepID=A0A4S4AFY9_9RHOO|nr:transposase [Pseudothauera rhizosphaerae]THF58116.1 transposase [Pseudothauera rhizosphaerae]
MNAPHRPQAARLRRGRFSETGRIYLVSTVTRERQPVFRDFTLARLAIRELAACDALEACETLAFVLMPDHLHWLLDLGTADLSALLRRFKSTSARRVNAARNTAESPLWQTGFHDHALRREEDVAQVARYVVANPVRSGLVRSVRDYPHWNAVWL